MIFLSLPVYVSSILQSSNTTNSYNQLLICELFVTSNNTYVYTSEGCINFCQSSGIWFPDAGADDAMTLSKTVQSTSYLWVYIISCLLLVKSQCEQEPDQNKPVKNLLCSKHTEPFNKFTLLLVQTVSFSSGPNLVYCILLFFSNQPSATELLHH